MVKMGQDSLVVAALLASVRESCKVTIYYINGALLILFHNPLYMSKTNGRKYMIWYNTSLGLVRILGLFK